MNKNEVEQKVRGELAKLGLAGSPAGHEKLCDVPGWDSLRQARFIIWVQQEFKMRLQVSDIQAMDTVDSSVAKILERISFK